MDPNQQQNPLQVQASVATPTIPFHTHGGSDGPLIPLGHVNGYLPMTTVQPTFMPTGGISTQIIPDSTRNRIWYYDTTNRVWKSALGQPSVVSITSSSSYTINTDLYDCLSITALAATINTIDTSGSPVNFQRLIVRIKDNGSPQTITWSAKFASYGSTLPTTTTANKISTVGFLYDSVAALWGCVAVQLQP